AGRAVARAIQANGLQHLVDAVTLLAGQARTQAGPYRLVGLLRQFEVLEHAQGLEHSRLLELAADAGLGNFHLAHAGQVELFAEVGHAGVRAGLAGDHVHHRGLAGAVGADDAAQLADTDVQSQVGQRLEAIEADVDVFQGEDGAVADVDALAQQIAGVQRQAGGVEGGFEHGLGYGSGSHCSLSFYSSPTTPLGRYRVTTMISAPRANSQYSG